MQRWSDLLTFYPLKQHWKYPATPITLFFPNWIKPFIGWHFHHPFLLANRTLIIMIINTKVKDINAAFLDCQSRKWRLLSEWSDDYWLNPETDRRTGGRILFSGVVLPFSTLPILWLYIHLKHECNNSPFLDTFIS